MQLSGFTFIRIKIVKSLLKDNKFINTYLGKHTHTSFINLSTKLDCTDSTPSLETEKSSSIHSLIHLYCILLAWNEEQNELLHCHCISSRNNVYMKLLSG